MSNTPGMVVKKLGQPVPESNFISVVKRAARSQPRRRQRRRDASLRSAGWWPAALGAFLAHYVERTATAASCATRPSTVSTGSAAEGTIAPAGKEALPVLLQVFDAFHGGRRCGVGTSLSLRMRSARKLFNKVRRFHRSSFQDAFPP